MAVLPIEDLLCVQLASYLWRGAHWSVHAYVKQNQMMMVMMNILSKY